MNKKEINTILKELNEKIDFIDLDRLIIFMQAQYDLYDAKAKVCRDKNDLVWLKTYVEYALYCNAVIECLQAWKLTKTYVNIYSHDGCNNEDIEYVQISEQKLPDSKDVEIIRKAQNHE